VSEATVEAPPLTGDHGARGGKAIVRARGLVRTYRMGNQSVDVLSGADVDLYSGETVAIMGRSGAGKSTLLHALGLLDRPDTGTLEIHGVESTTLGRGGRSRLRNQRIGFVFQFCHLIPELSALENALLPRRIELGPLAWFGKAREMRQEAASLLEELGLADRMAHRPNQLSGGERQRVAIARALVTRPSLLLCDEPTGNLDERTSEVIADLLFQLGESRDHTLVMVTHDPELASRADRVLQMHEGKLETLQLGL